MFGFLFFLSGESKRKQNPKLLQYIKQRLVLLLLLPFFFDLIKTSGIHPIGQLIAYNLSKALLIICFGIVVLVLLYYIEPIFLKRLKHFAARQTLVFVSTTLVATVVPSIFMLLFIRILAPSSDLNLLSLWYGSSTLFLLIVLLAALRVFYNFIHHRMQSMVNQKDVEIAKMKELKNQAELNALHSRINPHFLYNALNSIASLAAVDAGKTENMALGLSDLFRYSINKENKTMVAVAEELEMVKKYLEIEKTRFGDKLEYEIRADESCLDRQIPIFLIQPLVENAVKHGLSKIKDPGRIIIEIKKNKKELIIAIFDNGPDFPAEPVSGYGLQNLYDKLEIIYGNNAGIKWENGANKHIEVSLKNQFES